MNTEVSNQNLEVTSLTITATESDCSVTEEEDTDLRCELDNARAAGAESIWGKSDRDIAVCRHLWPVLPTYFGAYVEPFLGHSYFFWLTCYNRGWQRAILGDADQRLIEIYDLIRSSARPILERLDSWPVPKPTQRTPFLFDNVDDEIGRIAHIARTGAWLDLTRHLDKELRRNFESRVRKLETDRILACRDVLDEFAGIEFVVSDFAETVKSVVAGDFVFLDLPSQFSKEEHVRAAACFRNLEERGVSCVAAVPVDDDVVALYNGFEVQNVLGPIPTPKRKSKKSKVIEPPTRPIVAKFAVGNHAHK